MVWLGNPWWVLFFDGFVRSLRAYPQTYRYPARKWAPTNTPAGTPKIYDFFKVLRKFLKLLIELKMP